MEYHGKYVYSLGRIQKIEIIIRTHICYTDCRFLTQTVAYTLPGFQCLRICMQYLATRPHKSIFSLLVYIKDQILSDLYGVRIRFKTTPPKFSGMPSICTPCQDYEQDTIGVWYYLYSSWCCCMLEIPNK